MVVFTLSIFYQKYIFGGEFGPKNKNCQFELKFGTQTNSNMHNLVVMQTFSVIEQKYPFGANLVQKNNFQFKLKFGTQINSNMHNSMVVFTFSVLEWEYHF